MELGCQLVALLLHVVEQLFGALQHVALVQALDQQPLTHHRPADVCGRYDHLELHIHFLLLYLYPVNSLHR